MSLIHAQKRVWTQLYIYKLCNYSTPNAIYMSRVADTRTAPTCTPSPAAVCMRHETDTLLPPPWTNYTAMYTLTYQIKLIMNNCQANRPRPNTCNNMIANLTNTYIHKLYNYSSQLWHTQRNSTAIPQQQPICKRTYNIYKLYEPYTCNEARVNLTIYI